MTAAAPTLTATRAELDAVAEWLRENQRPCPVIHSLTPEQGLYLHRQGEDVLATEVAERNRIIGLMESDPLRYGHVPECWNDAERIHTEAILTAIFGGGGSSKTTFSAKLGVKKCLTKPGAKVLWLHEAEQASIDIQQRMVYDYLPPEWKRLKKKSYDRVTSMGYSRATGFSNNKFVLPNGSLGKFGNYNQDVADYEGYGWDLVLADENLPLGWLKTLLFRLPRCGGKLVWTFTPIHGITPAIKEVVTGAKIRETRKAELLDQTKVHVVGCPRGHMPYIQEGVWCDSRIIYFFTEMNPWSGYEQHKKIMAKATTEEVERRTYGWARNSIGKMFPKFGDYNIIPPDRVPKEVTRYVFKDPASARNAFITWVAVDRHRRHYIYREWPDAKQYGEWAITSEDSKKWDGDPGPAQRPLGLGIADYKREMLLAEGNRYANGRWSMDGERILERRGDPRAMAAPSGSDETGGATIFDRYLEAQQDSNGWEMPPMDFIPAPGYHIHRGVEAINDLLSWNPNEPVTALVNEPRLYVTTNCRNTIWALENWTGADGEKGACKDPIDNVRMMATSDLHHYDPTTRVSTGGGSY